MKYSDLKENKEIKALIEKGNSNLGVLGYTDHSQAHAALVANRAADILKKLGYKKAGSSWQKWPVICMISEMPLTEVIMRNTEQFWPMIF